MDGLEVWDSGSHAGIFHWNLVYINIAVGIDGCHDMMDVLGIKRCIFTSLNSHFLFCSIHSEGDIVIYHKCHKCNLTISLNGNC